MPLGIDPVRPRKHPHAIDFRPGSAATPRPDQTPTFEPWRLRLDAARFESLIAAMSNGKTLHIGWTIDRAGEHFAYNLKDFGQIATVSQDSCPASGTPQPTPTGE